MTTVISSPGEIGTNRVEAFSDGVFAIATTLLILEVAVPHAEDGQLGSMLLGLWPSYLAYALGFFTIAVMWINHHFLIGLLTRIDRPLIFLNVAVLGIVAFIPFPTAVIAEYMIEPSESNLSAASVLYGITIFLLTATFTALWAHVRRSPRLSKDFVVSKPISSRALVFCSIAAVLNLAAIGISFVFPIVALVFYTIVVILFAVGRLAR
ncbi:TMEM175 family protein [Subtercola boreus]|nr:TMEM175 family protein [Subtercola boreus]